MNRRRMLLALVSSAASAISASALGADTIIRNYTTLKVRNYGCSPICAPQTSSTSAVRQTIRSNTTSVSGVPTPAVSTVRTHSTTTTVPSLNSNNTRVESRSTTIQRNSCPGGVCPPTIRTNQRWHQIDRYGRRVSTSAKHLIEVHGFTPETIAAHSDLDLLHGSPDAPRNPHTWTL